MDKKTHELLIENICHELRIQSPEIVQKFVDSIAKEIAYDDTYNKGLYNVQDIVDRIIADLELEKDYNNKLNKPKINSIELIGDKSLDELDIQEKGDYPVERVTNLEIDNLFN